jgi:hypothetical protein
LTRARTYLLLALAVGGMLAAAAHAQATDDGEGPIVITKPARPSYLTLDPFYGSVGLMGIYQKQTLNSPGSSTNSTNMLFTQQLNLGTGGNIVSPNILHWNASGSVTFEEENSSLGLGALGDQSTFGTFTAYDISADILSGTVFPTTLYARRSDIYVDRAFASMLRDATTEYGGIFRYNSPSLPTTLSLTHTTTEQTDLAGNQQFSIDQNQLTFDTSFQPTERQQLALSLSYTATEQINPNQRNTPLESLNGAVTHNWVLDKEGRYVLSSNFNYNQQNGQYPLTYMRLNEQLHLRHTDTFETNYSYQFNSQENNRSTLTTNLFAAGFTHRLFQSLVTTGGLSASLTSNSFAGGPDGSAASSADSQNLAATIGTSYTKKVWLGTFGANLSLGYSQDNNSAVGQTQQIQGEPHSFSATDTITLIRTGINPSPSNFHLYNRNHIELFDFTVRHVGNTIVISRSIGGDLTDVNDVLMNYLVDPLPGYTSRTTTFGAGANYAFDEGLLKGLNLYGRYFQADQSISPANSLIRPDNIRDAVLGAEYRVWKLTLRAESQMHDSTLAPYDALRFTARYADRLGERTTLSLSATQHFIDYPQDHTRTAITTVDGQLEYQIMRDLRAILTARWRNDDDSVLGNIMGVEEQGELRWTIRQTDVYFILRHTALQATSSDSSNLLFQLGITRNF